MKSNSVGNSNSSHSSNSGRKKGSSSRKRNNNMPLVSNSAPDLLFTDSRQQALSSVSHVSHHNNDKTNSTNNNRTTGNSSGSNAGDLLSFSGNHSSESKESFSSFQGSPSNAPNNSFVAQQPSFMNNSKIAPQPVHPAKLNFQQQTVISTTNLSQSTSDRLFFGANNPNSQLTSDRSSSAPLNETQSVDKASILNLYQQPSLDTALDPSSSLQQGTQNQVKPKSNYNIDLTGLSPHSRSPHFNSNPTNPVSHGNFYVNETFRTQM